MKRTEKEKHKKNKTFEHEGDKYYIEKRSFEGFPRITGFPKISFEPIRPYKKGYIRDKYGRKKIIYGKLKAPRKCNLKSLINWNFRKFGAPLISINGNYGEGKSNLMTFILALFLAKKLHVIMLIDRAFEIRNLAMHGYFDNDNNFHPFIIDVFIPKGYEFLNSNPLWESRKNVNLIEWSNVDKIIASMAPGKVTAVYDECFDEASKIKLWIDIIIGLGEAVTVTKHYMFSHHELSSLFPETPTKEIYKLVRLASNLALSLRKNRIGMLTTFHMSSEVFYRISQKFGYVLHKKPVNRSTMTTVEKNARGFAINEVNVSRGGYWMKHTIGEYPEMTDKYRLVPKREKITYPDFKTNEAKEEIIFIDEKDFAICQLKAQGHAWRTISERVGLSLSQTYERGKRLQLKGENIS